MTGRSTTIPSSRPTWDLVVVGGGTAGIVTAKTAVALGARVIMVERDRPGGDCLWTGCVPSKTLLSAAHAAADARAAARFGIHADRVHVDFAEVMARVHAAIALVEPADSPETLHAAGVHVLRGTAEFTGRQSVRVDGDEIRFRQALVATGASPLVPPIPGLVDVSPLTSETVWDLEKLPGRLVVLGGGSVGCELGQAFARLGSQVAIVEAAARLLPREDIEAADLLTAQLRSDGIIVHTGLAADAIVTADGHRSLRLADGTEVGFDEILVAVGRRPRTTWLGLERAGVDVDRAGFVLVDRRLRTSNRRIFAAGDVTRLSQFTHTAGVHASIAASNAVLGLRRSIDPATAPRVTFTQPEIAAVGLDREQAERDGLTVATTYHDDVDRAQAEDSTRGFSRLVLDGRGRVVGATIVSPRAGESLAEVTLAVRHGLRVQDLAGATHPYPTYSDGVWQTSVDQVRLRLERPALRGLTEALGRGRRWWLSR